MWLLVMWLFLTGIIESKYILLCILEQTLGWSDLNDTPVYYSGKGCSIFLFFFPHMGSLTCYSMVIFKNVVSKHSRALCYTL